MQLFTGKQTQDGKAPNIPFTNGCMSTHMNLKEVHSVITLLE